MVLLSTHNGTANMAFTDTANDSTFATETVPTDTRKDAPYSKSMKRLFGKTPVILAVIQYTILVVIMATTWFGKSPPEVPYTWHGPASSLLMGIILSLYYKHELEGGNIPHQVFWSSVGSVVVTSILLVLACLFPERECCCEGGVQPQRVTKGTCPKPSTP